jgi:hypothetical protein
LAGTCTAQVGFQSETLLVSDAGHLLGLAVGDFDGDGNSDVAELRQLGYSYYGPDANLQVFFGDGAGGFRSSTTFLSGDAGYFGFDQVTWEAVAAGDLNGDGITDLVLSAEIISYDYQIGQCQMGAWALAFNIVYGARDGGLILSSAFPSGSCSEGGWNLEAGDLLVADLNSDGRPDIVQLLLTEPMILYASLDGGYELAQPLPPSSDQAAYVYSVSGLVGDVNGDGRNDLIYQFLGPALDELVVLLQTPDGGLELADDDTALGYSDVLLCVGGRAVVLVGDTATVVEFSPDAGLVSEATYQLWSATASDGGFGSIGVSQTVDMNGDGIPDLVLSTGAGIVVLMGLDGGGYGGAGTIPASDGDFTFLTAADFNGDGRPDIAAVSSEPDRYTFGLGPPIEELQVFLNSCGPAGAHP